jgi:fibronectin type 3 domain-containing protein
MNLLSQTQQQLSARNKNRSFVKCSIVLLLLTAAFAGSVQAQSVTLAWDPVSGVSGYKLYQGGASRVYTNSINTGTATQEIISGLNVGATYYFAVTAYDSNGLESDYSSEIIYVVTSSRPPPLAVLKLTKLAGGKMNLSALGIAGHVYEVQATSNLQTWALLGKVTANASGAITYTDTKAPLYSYRCYRLRDTKP